MWHVAVLTATAVFAAPTLFVHKPHLKGRYRADAGYSASAVFDKAFAAAGLTDEVHIHQFGSVFSLISRSWPDSVADVYERQHVYAKREGINPRTMEYSPVGRRLVKTVQRYQRTYKGTRATAAVWFLTSEANQLPQALLVITDGYCASPLSLCEKEATSEIRVFRIDWSLKARSIRRHRTTFTRVAHVKLVDGAVTDEWYAARTE
jgi:hypothetical protein